MECKKERLIGRTAKVNEPPHSIDLILLPPKTKLANSRFSRSLKHQLKPGSGGKLLTIPGAGSDYIISNSLLATPRGS